MCGITGFAGFSDGKLLRRMCHLLTHRGPDDAGFYETPNASLAMRRLAIIDLAGGHQPIANEDGTVWVVLNGEIYNYESLREDLIARGHTLKTRSDTETLVHLYEDYGVDFVAHLRGMFGIALWDERRNRLVLARDRIGEKPLYYAQARDGLLFGSEPKSVLAGLDRRTADSQAVCDFLATGYVAGARTFYDSMRKLPPGHLLVYEDGRISESRYWQLDCSDFEEMSFDRARDEIEEELERAVELCMKSDVEVAAFLSGGLDSSLLVALMRKLGLSVKTFSVGYGGQATGFNELNFARQVSEAVGTEHRELILDARSNIELLPKIIWHYDEPHGEPTSMLVYLLCRFVRDHVKVAVGGTGGDELFYGYPRHKGFRYLSLYRRLPRFVRKQIVERVVAGIPESTRGNRFAKRVRRFVSNSGNSMHAAYLGWVRLLSEPVHEALVSSGVRTAAEHALGDEFLRHWLLGDERRPPLGAAAQVDIQGYLPEYQLTYMDRMSMAASLEVRSPFCDYRLVERAVSVPPRHRLNGSTSKYVLKRIAERYLPNHIVHRRKVGFDSPIGQWLKTDLRQFLLDFLAPEQVAATGLLAPGAVQNLVHDHLSGKRDYSLLLWSVIALEAWYRMYIEDGVLELGDYGLNDLRGAERFRADRSMAA
jgi:asparagine synthase (glutamine-hydrolysing)